MLEVITYWYYSLSMEQVFILTGISIILVGMTLGLLGGLISCKNERNNK